MPNQLGPADFRLNDYFIFFRFPDIAAASSIYLPIPQGGEIIETGLVNSVVVDGANAVLTLSKLPLGVVANAVAVGGTITVLTAGSAIGLRTVQAHSGANRFVSNRDTLRLTSDGGPTTANPTEGYILIRR